MNRKIVPQFLVISSLITVACLFLGVMGVSAANPPAPRQRIIVHVSTFSEDEHTALMAMHMAENLQKLGADVTLLLDVSGVRLAVKPHKGGTESPFQADLSASYDAFIKAGGKVLICPHCFHEAHLKNEDLRPGAYVGKSVEELAQAVLAADKTIDY